MKKVTTSILSLTPLAFGCVAQISSKGADSFKLQIDAIVRPLAEAGDLNGYVLVVKNGEHIYE
jgi:hypothetical protein